MNFWHRRGFLSIASIIFLVLAPVLVVLSLGFDTNLNKTLTTKIENYPRGGQILVDGQLITSAPGEITSIAGKKIQVEVARDDFLTEQFWLWNDGKENGTANIANLWMLPKKPVNDPTNEKTQSSSSNSVSSPNNPENPTTKIIQILSENQLLAKQKIDGKEKIFLLKYDANGLDEVENQTPIQLADFGTNTSFFSNFGTNFSPAILEGLNQLRQGQNNSQNTPQNSPQTTSQTNSQSPTPAKNTQNQFSSQAENNSNTSSSSSSPTQAEIDELNKKLEAELNQKLLLEKQAKFEQNISKLENSGNWQDLEYDAFWNHQNQFLIYLFEGKWQFLDASFGGSKFASVSRISTNQILFLRSDSSLWLLNLSSGKLDFIDNGYNGMSFSTAPENVWLWKNNKLFSLKRGQIDATSFEPAIFFQNKVLQTKLDQDILSNKTEIKTELDVVPAISQNSLKVRSLFQGLAIKFGTEAIYIPDIDQSRWRYISNKILDISTDGNNIFWVDEAGYIYTKNLFLNTHIQLGSIQIDGEMDNLFGNLSLYYSPDWSRLMIYNNNQVHSVWLSKDSLGTSIKSRVVHNWLQNIDCFNRIVASRQYCIGQNGVIAENLEPELLIYKNTRIF